MNIEDAARAKFADSPVFRRSDTEIRFGQHGSKHVDLITGRWKDYETDDWGYFRANGAAGDSNDRKNDRPVSLIVDKYDYLDSEGQLRYQVCRYAPKTFRPRRPDTLSAGRWIWSLKGVEALPYRLNDFVDSEFVVINEGEKAVDACSQFMPATCSNGGAGNWPPEINQYFEGKDVFIVPDNDVPGRQSARRTAKALLGVARSVRICDVCRGMAVKDDLYDWISANGGETLYDVLQSYGVVTEVEEIDFDESNVFDTFSAEDVREVTATEDFVEDLLLAGQMSVLYGPSNSGKTFFACDLALHIALGSRWRDREVDGGGVVYIAAEGAYGLRNRIIAFRNYYNEVPGRFWVVPSSVNLLDSDEDLEKLINTISAKHAAYGVSLIVIDTLARVMSGGNENSSEDMGALVINCDKLRAATSAHVLLIHHTGKDEAKGARGHSSLRAATDTEIEILAGNGGSTARVTKQRELEGGGEFPFRLETVTIGKNSRGKDVTSCVVRPVDEVVAPKKPPRYPNQKIVLNALRGMIIDDLGGPLPVDMNMPMGIKSVLAEDLFVICKNKFACDPRHKRGRFDKAIEGLMGVYLNHERGYLWLLD